MLCSCVIFYALSSFFCCCLFLYVLVVAFMYRRNNFVVLAVHFIMYICMNLVLSEGHDYETVSGYLSQLLSKKKLRIDG